MNRGLLVTRTGSADETQALAGAVAGLAERGDIIVLAGDLGTGKTVWVKGFASALGVTEPVTSPTFTLVRPYEGTRLRLLHADVYRLDRLREVTDLDLVEQLDERAVACIEWGDLAEPALPADFLEVRLEQGEEEAERTVTFRPVGARWHARMGDLRARLESWVVAP